MRVRLRQLLQRGAHRRPHLERRQPGRDRPDANVCLIAYGPRCSSPAALSAGVHCRARQRCRSTGAPLRFGNSVGVSILAGCSASASSALWASGTTRSAPAVFPCGRSRPSTSTRRTCRTLPLAVDVTLVEPEQLARTQPGQRADDRDHAEVGRSSSRDRLKLLDRGERQHLASVSAPGSGSPWPGSSSSRPTATA